MADVGTPHAAARPLNNVSSCSSCSSHLGSQGSQSGQRVGVEGTGCIYPRLQRARFAALLRLQVGLGLQLAL